MQCLNALLSIWLYCCLRQDLTCRWCHSGSAFESPPTHASAHACIALSNQAQPFLMYPSCMQTQAQVPGIGQHVCQSLSHSRFNYTCGMQVPQILDAIQLSHATFNKIRQNLWWAFGYNLVGIPLAAGALLPSMGIALTPSISGLSNGLCYNSAQPALFPLLPCCVSNIHQLC